MMPRGLLVTLMQAAGFDGPAEVVAPEAGAVLNCGASLLQAAKHVMSSDPPSATYRPRSSFYHGWYNNNYSGYGYVTTPGYAVERQLVNMETNLYRVLDGMLVWSALSRTWLQRSDAPGDEVNPIVRQLVGVLSRESVIVKKTDR